MVLQRDAAAPVWGWAEAGEEVRVSIGGPATLTLQGANTITINDVLVGEVWLCSGQSNMGFHVAQAENFAREKAAAEHPKLRLFTDASGPAAEPQEKGRGSWVVCTPDTVGPFSATAYFFRRDLHAKLGVAVGLVHSLVGGTPIEAWTSREAQQDVPEVKFTFERWAKNIATWDPKKAQEHFATQKAAYPALVEQAKPAATRIAGDRLIFCSPEIAAPVAVRYAWAGDPEWSLLNAAGLPASPFRTDNWPFTTPPR